MNSRRCKNSPINSATNRSQYPNMNAQPLVVPCNASLTIPTSSVSSTSFLRTPRYQAKNATALGWNPAVSSTALSAMGTLDPTTETACSAFQGDSHLYRCIPGRGYSGLTRIVWELNPVKYRQGGTLFITASHKAVYTAPDTIRSQDSPIWDTYQCPAGSLLFFTEALTHSTHTWTNEGNDRLAIFSCYNTVNSKWHDWDPHPKLLEEMPAKRQTLFRPRPCG